LRTVRVLEQIGTAPARAMLSELAGGADGTRETEAARAALSRLKEKSSP
jgi:phosphotransacetylase